MIPGLEITPVNAATDPGFTTVVAVRRADDAVRNPGDPVSQPQVIAADLFVSMPDYRRIVTVAELDGAPAGLLTAVYRTEADGDTWHADVDVTVLAQHRRRGIAEALVNDALPQLTDTGVNSVLTYVTLDLDPEPAVALCQHYGLTKRSEERCSRTVVAEVDDDMIHRWIAEAATTASSYRIEVWEGPCPDGLLEPWCRAAAAIEDAPTGDLDYDDYIRGPEAQQAADAVSARRGLRIYRSLVLTDDGQPAGMTELFVNGDAPYVGHQGNTGVLAPHRGHGIGRWLKAVNHRQVVAAQPGVQVIETFNAEANPWMLDINVAMGFRPHHSYAMYQAPLDTALSVVPAE